VRQRRTVACDPTRLVELPMNYALVETRRAWEKPVNLSF